MFISNIFKIKGKETKYINKSKLDLSIDLADFKREEFPKVPQANESQVVRHFTKLSQLNFGLDTGFYPLGSCTMKYNPKLNEVLGSIKNFTELHPYQDLEDSQGAIQAMYELGEMLKDISGMDGISLVPAAGAHGESTGLKLIDEYHKANGGFRTKVLIPDTAHGTNPASSTMTGHDVITIKSGVDGIIKYEDIAPLIDKETSCLMLTNPNTLGLFESDMHRIAEKLKSEGALLYCDGANTNAWMGKVNMGELGVDVLQYNLHKTFSTPHGGGGPGSGPITVSKKLLDFLPEATVVKENNKYKFIRPSKSIGRIKAYYGNFLIMLRAFAYILNSGKDGLNTISDIAVLNANYIRKKLEKYYHLPYQTDSMHEVVFTDKYQKEYNISTMDIAKRLLDYGVHAPTIYFPLVVSGALMIEPTETESLAEIDKFCNIMIKIANEAKNSPELLKNSPNGPVKRINEAKAARDLILKESI